MKPSIRSTMSTFTTPAAATPAPAGALTPEQQADIDALLRLEKQVQLLLEAHAKARGDAENKLLKDLGTGETANQLTAVVARLKTWDTFTAQSDLDRKSLEGLAALVKSRRDRLTTETPELARAYFLKKLAALRTDRLREQADVTKVDTDIKDVEAQLARLGCDPKATAV